MGGGAHELMLRELTRRGLLRNAAASALALSAAGALISPRPARAQSPLDGLLGNGVSASDATLQAFADTMLPGRRVERTESGAPVHPQAIAGADPLPGAVEADALAVYHHPEIGFDPLAPPFLSELEARSLQQGGPFLTLDFQHRVSVCVGGLDQGNPSRVLWEAAAAIPFVAFCAATLVPEQTAAKAVGYRVMGLPGVAPAGYRRGFSYRRRLSRERTRTGSLR
jgi:hypothetical protein